LKQFGDKLNALGAALSDANVLETSNEIKSTLEELATFLKSQAHSDSSRSRVSMIQKPLSEEIERLNNLNQERVA
jgi:hypothetical protein